jgi:hypothetical protein
MDFNDYWQENKRFVLTVLGGLIVFWIGTMAIDSFIGSELRGKRRTRQTLQSQLGEERFLPRDLSQARSENEALLGARDALAQRVAWTPRPEFRLDPARGSAGNQYFATAQRVREELLRRAGRSNVRIDQDLGLPALAPTRDDEIERHLEALDLVERVVGAAIDERVERVDDIEIKLDPGLRSRRGTGRVERTRVKLRMVGGSGPMLRVLARTQAPEEGASLVIEELEAVPERTKNDEVRLEVTFLVPRVTAAADLEEEL